MSIRLLLSSLGALLALVSSGPASAASFADLDVPPPSIDAASYILLDGLTGTVIAAQAADRPYPPASLVKMMTSYLAFAAVRDGIIELDETVTISPRARNANGSRTFLEVNSEVSIRDLLKGLIVQSGNDAAVALAERLAGTEENFANLMNQQARLLGMTSSNFANSTGLPAQGQVSTANDLGLLARALAIEFPKLYELYALTEFEHNNILQKNRNRMLGSYAGADGLKTGYTREAGYCLAASAQRKNMRLIGVVLKSKSARSRVREMTALLNHGFTHYRSIELFTPGQLLDEVKVWGGEVEQVNVGYGAEQPLHLLLSRAQANDLQAVLINNGKPVEAPVAIGDEIARIRISSGETELASLPAVALENVAAGPWWRRLTDFVRLHWLEPATP